MSKRKKGKFLYGCLLLAFFIALLLTGCGKNDSTGLKDYEEHFQEEEAKYQITTVKGMAEELAVVSVSEATDYGFQANVKAAFCANDDQEEVLLSYHAFDKIYPASITKVMTALLVMEQGDFDEEVTLTHNITFDEGNVVRTNLKEGDTVTVEALFNALLVASDNDCAVILAEYVAGSVDAFTDMMNARAKELGATHTHFANANGLHNSNHYTTAYDLYLIFREALKDDRFVTVVGQKDYILEYTTAQGYVAEEYQTSTNAYFSNTYPIPTGIEVVGGKTGTTSMAKSCLILLTKNEEGENMISVVLGAESKDVLYQTMTDLITR